MPEDNAKHLNVSNVSMRSNVQKIIAVIGMKQFKIRIVINIKVKISHFPSFSSTFIFPLFVLFFGSLHC